MGTRTFSALLDSAEGIQFSRKTNIQIFCGLIGFGVAYAYLFLLYAGSAPFPRQVLDEADSFICRIVLLFSTCLFMWLWIVLDRRCSDKAMRGIYAIATCLSVGLVPAYSLLGMNDPLLTFSGYALWALAGFYCAWSYIEWSSILCFLRRGNAIAFMAVANAIAALIYIGVEWMDEPFALFFVAFLPFVAFAFNSFFMKEKGSSPVSGAQKNVRYSRQAWDSVLFTLMQCFGVGFGIACLLACSQVFSANIVSSLYAIAIAISCVLVLVDWRLWHRLNEDSVWRYCYLEIAVLVFMLLFLDAFYIVPIAGILLVSFMWTSAIIGCCTEAESAKIISARPKMALARSWVFSVLGIGLGLFAGWVGYESGFYHSTSLVFVLGLLIIVVLAAAAFTSRPNASMKKILWPMVEDSQGVQVDLAGSQEGGDLLSSQSSGEAVQQAQDIEKEDDGPEKQGGRFRECCNELADIGRLSMRQREVFFLLARGRDSKYIQKKLYISQSTADSHIYSVYKKLGVHSKQELIDLVEHYRNGEVTS